MEGKSWGLSATPDGGSSCLPLPHLYIATQTLLGVCVVFSWDTIKTRSSVWLEKEIINTKGNKRTFRWNSAFLSALRAFVHRACGICHRASFAFHPGEAVVAFTHCRAVCPLLLLFLQRAASFALNSAAFLSSSGFGQLLREQSIF